MKTLLRASLLFAFGLVVSAQTYPFGPQGNIPCLTTNTAIGTATLSNFQVVGCLTGTPTGAATYTTPTAAALCSYFRNVLRPGSVPYSWPLWIINTSGGANTITIAGGTGMTLVGTGTTAQNFTRALIFTLTNCTSGSEAGSIISLSTAAF